MIPTLRTPDIRRQIERDRLARRRAIEKAALNATDRAAREGVVALRAKMRGVRLGNLANAVGQTSAKQKRVPASRGNAWGAWYARGGDDSLGGGALEAYSRGARIVPQSGHYWLWIPTPHIQRRIKIGRGRYRITPARWIGSSLEQSVGKLVFRQLSAWRALLVVQDVTLSPKTGIAKKKGPRATRTRVPVKEIVAFVGIRVTTRAQRFDKDQLAQAWARRVPEFMAEELELRG
ncbi:MAG: hypothetical protein K2X76_05205 [Sphingomonas sp.]|nr:hypothetical protein [Sphingomonas sp.]